MTVSEHTPPCFLFSLSLAGRWGWGGIRWTRPTLLEDSFLPAIFSFWLKELDCKVLTKKKLCLHSSFPGFCMCLLYVTAEQAP
jgi:hypothetical protein